MDLLRCPGYAVPLGVNLTGSVWFFLLIGKAGEFFGDSGSSFGGLGEGCRGEGGAGWGLMVEMKRSLGIGVGTIFADVAVELSLTVPITNSLAFLFTVLGEWWAEGKVISRG